MREAIVARPRDWEKLGRAGLALQGDALRRPPRGFDPDHRHIEDLKRKDFITSVRLTEKEICSAGFLGKFVTKCARAAPLVKFLAGALELPW